MTNSKIVKMADIELRTTILWYMDTEPSKAQRKALDLCMAEYAKRGLWFARPL